MVHNITVVVLLGLIYSSLCLALIIRTKMSKNMTLTSNVQKLVSKSLKLKCSNYSMYCFDAKFLDDITITVYLR
jgi:hypothetical protein